ncbi:arylsulfatase, partial [Bacteroides sp. AF25-38AC]
DHAFGGAAVFQLTHQVNSDIENAKVKPDAPKGQLYNLEKDPYQTMNVYNKYPKVVKKMARLLDRKVNRQNSTRK